MNDKKPITEAAKRLINDSRFRESKKDNDTLRLWENYREQALLWRAMALLQIPATVIALIFAITMWSNRVINLNVPARPLPGHYSADEIQDSEFLTVGEQFINLVATYQPYVAEKQFLAAAEMLEPPVLSMFEEEVLGKDLEAIKQTSRTQVYYIDPTKTTITREEKSGLVKMRTVGERHKTIGGEPLPPDTMQYYITMKTFPKNVKYNDYGIMIVNIETGSPE